MTTKNITNNRKLVFALLFMYILGTVFAFVGFNDYQSLRYTFDKYEYSYDKHKWTEITPERLEKTSFKPKTSLYIRAYMDEESFNKNPEEQVLAIETNDIGTAGTVGNKLLFNDLYRVSAHSKDFIYGNNVKLKIKIIDDVEEVYKNGITLEMAPYNIGDVVNIYILSLYSDNEYYEGFSKMAFSKVFIGVVLIALGSIFLITISSALSGDDSLSYRYYSLGAISISVGICVLFLGNFYFTEQSRNYDFLIRAVFIITYSMTIPITSILYDKFVEVFPSYKTAYKLLFLNSVVLTGVLIFSITTDIISNRTANRIFISYNVTTIVLAIIIAIHKFYLQYRKSKKIDISQFIIESIYLSAYIMLLINISELLNQKLSLTADVSRFRVFLLFNFLWIILYTYETKFYANTATKIKSKTEKTTALTNIMLDMNKKLVGIESTNVRDALNECINILNEYLPELVYWENLIFEEDNKYLTVEEKMELETALEYGLICNTAILNNDIVEVGTSDEIIIVGVCKSMQHYQNKIFKEHFEVEYNNIMNDTINQGEIVLRSTIPQFKDVMLLFRGFDKFTDEHRDMLLLNMKIVFDSIENILIQNEMKRNQRQIIYDLTTISESKSKETFNHVKRVVNYTRVLAEGLGFSEEETELVSIASAMHDLGKISTPFEILHKNGRLTEEEFDVIKRHTGSGYDILKVNEGELFNAAAIIARDHHEKYNGRGYNRTKGEDIHIYARIVALADVFDALASDRSYKKAWPLDKVFNMIIAESGEHFDPKVVDVFVDRFNEFLDIKRMYVD